MNKGFKKISFSSGTSKSENPKRKSKGYLKVIFTVFGIVFLLFFVFLAFIVIPLKDIYASVQKASQTGVEAYQSVKNQDISQTVVKLKDTENRLHEVEGQVRRIEWMKYLPFIGVYARDAQSLVKIAIAGTLAGEITASTIEPYSDLLGFKGKSTFVSGSADDRIKTAVETLDKVTPKLSEISEQIAIIGHELDQIDENRYPEKIGRYKIKSQLTSAKDIFSQTAKLFVEAQPLLVKLPDLLGNKNPKTYLFLFQNDAELRATGGFITAYAIFNVDKGKMKVVKADDIYKLDESKRKSFPAPSPILKYHLNVNTLQLRDSNLSPDFPTSMKQFNDMLTQSVPDFPAYDAVVTFDTHVLVSALKILGDFNIYGRTFSAENDSRCDCAKVIYEMEDYSTRPVAYVREERKDIIGVFMYQIMQRALGVSPSKYWGRLFQMFLDEAKEKHILFNFMDTDAQKGIEAVDFGGAIKTYEGDYLHVSDVNFAGAKSNLFVRESVKQEIEVAADGTVTKTLTLDYKNPHPPSNCNLEAGQLCLNGILRNWLRIYVPKGSKLVSFNGSEKETVSYDELNKTVFEGFLTVKPQGASQAKVKYTLPFKIKSDKYNLFIQKQPGTDQNDYAVFYKGKQVDKFGLIGDKLLSFKS